MVRVSWHAMEAADGIPGATDQVLHRGPQASSYASDLNPVLFAVQKTVQWNGPLYIPQCSVGFTQ